MTHPSTGEGEIECSHFFLPLRAPPLPPLPLAHCTQQQPPSSSSTTTTTQRTLSPCTHTCGPPSIHASVHGCVDHNQHTPQRVALTNAHTHTHTRTCSPLCGDRTTAISHRHAVGDPENGSCNLSTSEQHTHEIEEENDINHHHSQCVCVCVQGVVFLPILLLLLSVTHCSLLLLLLLLACLWWCVQMNAFHHHHQQQQQQQVLADA